MLLVAMAIIMQPLCQAAHPHRPNLSLFSSLPLHNQHMLSSLHHALVGDALLSMCDFYATF
jgi:hypothetical protein